MDRLARDRAGQTTAVADTASYRNFTVRSPRRALALGNVMFLSMATLVAQSGCGGNDTNSSAAASTTVEQFASARASADEQDCRCRVELGHFRGWAECLDEIAPAPDETESCIQEVVDAHPQVNSNLKCANEAEEDLDSCLAESLCSEAEYNGCFAAYRRAYVDCGVVSQEALDAMNACF